MLLLLLLLLLPENVADSAQLLSGGGTRTLVQLHEMSQRLTSCAFSTTVRVQSIRSTVQRQGQNYVHYVYMGKVPCHTSQ